MMILASIFMVAPHRLPSRSMVPDFWQMLAMAVPVVLAVAAIVVFVHALIEHHTRPKRKPMGRKR